MPTVACAEGPLLDRVLDSTFRTAPDGLSRRALSTADAALRKTAWAPGHRRRYALVDSGEVLASAEQYDLAGSLDQRAVRICMIGGVYSDSAHGTESHARELIDHLIDDGAAREADLAIVCASSGTPGSALEGFEVIPTQDVELTVTESPRHGAPIALIRGGEDRDLPAIAAMGQTRAAAFRFHLDRDVDLVKYAVTRKRLRAGLAPVGTRQLLFVISEEGITAAAYAVISVGPGGWTIEECGDRDPRGARVGAILQALIAREPVERRPAIRGWLPPGFTPPQLAIVSRRPSAQVLLARPLSPPMTRLGLSAADVLYWRSDLI